MLICPWIASALGQSTDEAPVDPDEDVPEIIVTGQHLRDLSNTAGTTSVITESDLNRMAPISTTEALALAPGVFVNVEDMSGLRQNIGIRGLLPDRSGKVTILEDGVPVTLAPYGEPALYVTSVVDRLRRIEVTKGSGSIQYGPQTVGGVVNYVTHSAPERLRWHAEVRGGTWGHLQGIASIGNTVGQVGYRLDVSHLELGGDRRQAVSRTDINGRLDLSLDDRNTLVVKLQGYHEDSRATYLGLTTAQFAADPLLVVAPHDRFAADRIGTMVRHELAQSHWTVVNTLYGHQVSRDWRRQDFARTDDGADVLLEPGGRTRSRSFRVLGFESRTQFEARPREPGHRFEVGARGHLESIDERIFELDDVTVGMGDLGRDERRSTTAGAAWGLLSLEPRGGGFTLVPGLRLEAMRFVNTRLRNREGDLPEPAVATEDVVVLLPGLGGTVEPIDHVILFAGVHRGFSPPRTRDTLDDDGRPVPLDAEVSINSEIGIRIESRAWIRAELAAFHLDFRRQVVPPTESAFADDPLGVNSGESTHSGGEFGLWLDVGRALQSRLEIPVNVSGTLLRTRLGEGWGPDQLGNALPYAPAAQLTVALGAWHPRGWGAQVRTQVVGAMFADRGNTVAPTPDGLLGRIPARWVTDARVAWQHPASGLSVGLTVKNLTDAVYISSRSPRGIQPGPRRHVLLSVASRTPR